MTKKLNIVSVCRWLPTPDNSSAGIFIRRRLEAMNGIANVRVIQPVPYFPAVKRLPNWARERRRTIGSLSIEHANMFYIPRYMKGLDGRWLYRSIFGRLGQLSRSDCVDVVDAHFGYPDGVGSTLAANRLNLPVFITFRGLEADYVRDKRISNQITKALANATGCICVSHYLKELALQYGAKPESVIVVHNALNRELFCPGSRTDARIRLGLPPDSPVVVSVGNLAKVKRHDVLIESFVDVVRQHPTAKLFVIGGRTHGDEYPEQLLDLVGKLGLSEAVRFVGSVRPNDVVIWLRAANMFALASEREGCSNAVLEALAAGVPVVTTPVGDNTHFVTDDDNGFIVPVGNSGKLGRAISQGLRSERWDPHGIAASLKVGSWSQNASQVIEFFKERMQASPSLQA